MIKNDKILIIQTAFMGDVILALPMVQTIKNHLPGSAVDFLCVPGNVPVLTGSPAIRNVIPYDKKGGDKLDKFIEALSELRENEYDVIICPHRYFRSALLTYYSEAKTRIGFNRNTCSFLLTHKIPYRHDLHEIKRNLELVKAIPGIDYDESKASLTPHLYPSAEDENFVKDIFTGYDRNIIAVAPCSRWYTKQFPQEKTIELVTMLTKQNYTVVLLGGTEDMAYSEEIENKSAGTKLLNLCGKTSPLQSYLVMKNSKALITVDSAAQHIGAAAEIPIILIYGSTDRSFGFYPLNPKSRIVEVNGLDCRPCTDHGRDFCPKGHFKCMLNIEISEIYKSISEIISPLRGRDDNQQWMN